MTETRVDRLLILEEIADRTRMPLASVRFKKHKGEMDFIFRLGRRLVAYESECEAWIKAQRDAARESA